MNNAAIQARTKERQARAVQEVMQQYVTFVIANENYGVPVLKVQEIIGMTEIVPVPNSQIFTKGVINLRGSVVPVVDMRKRFRLEEREYDMFTVIIIVEVKGILVGMIVDSVSDVADIPAGSIQETPHLASKIDREFISGIGHINDKLAIILDIDRIFSVEEIKTLGQEEAAQARP
jgi:purine-binding chemotaxis protein CheW